MKNIISKIEIILNFFDFTFFNKKNRKKGNIVMKRALVVRVQNVYVKNISHVVKPNTTKNIYPSLFNISFAIIYEPNIPIIPHNTPNNQTIVSMDRPLSCENAESKNSNALEYENG